MLTYFSPDINDNLSSFAGPFIAENVNNKILKNEPSQCCCNKEFETPDTFLLFFSRKSRREGGGGSFVLEIQTGGEGGGGLVLQEIQVRGGGGGKKRPHPSGVCEFFSGITQCVMPFAYNNYLYYM